VGLCDVSMCSVWIVAYAGVWEYDVADVTGKKVIVRAYGVARREDYLVDGLIDRKEDVRCGLVVFLFSRKRKVRMVGIYHWLPTSVFAVLLLSRAGWIWFLDDSIHLSFSNTPLSDDFRSVQNQLCISLSSS